MNKPKEIYSWSRVLAKGNAPGPISAHSATYCMGKLYIFGGWNGSQMVNELYCFNPGILFSFDSHDMQHFVSNTQNHQIQKQCRGQSHKQKENAQESEQATLPLALVPKSLYLEVVTVQTT